MNVKQAKFRVKSKIFLLDSSTISHCLNLFDLTKYKTKKDAVKMYTLLDYDGNLPAIENKQTSFYQGAGLGLAISKRLAEMLNGNIWVESEINRGTTIRFKISIA